MFVASWSEVQVVWKSPSLQLIFEVRTVLTGENKNLTYKVFSNVIKLLWSLNLAINEVDNDVMFYRPFIKLVINFLKKNIIEVLRRISWMIMKKILTDVSFCSQYAISGILAIEAEKKRSPKLVSQNN